MNSARQGFQGEGKRLRRSGSAKPLQTGPGEDGDPLRADNTWEKVLRASIMQHRPDANNVKTANVDFHYPPPPADLELNVARAVDIKST